MSHVSLAPGGSQDFGSSWRVVSSLAGDRQATAPVDQASYPTTPSSVTWSTSHDGTTAFQEVTWLVPGSTAAADSAGLGQLQASFAPNSPLPQDLRPCGRMCVSQAGACKALAWDMTTATLPALQQQQQQQALEVLSLGQPLETAAASIPLHQQLLSLQLQGTGGLAEHLYGDAVQLLDDNSGAGGLKQQQQQQQQEVVVVAADGLCATPSPLQLLRRFSDSGSSVTSSCHHSYWPLPMASAPAAAAPRGVKEETLQANVHTAPVLQVVLPNDCNSGVASPATPHQLVCLSDGTLLAVSAPAAGQPPMSSPQLQQQQQGLMFAGSSYIMLPPDAGVDPPSTPNVVTLSPGGALQGSWGQSGATLVTLSAPGHPSGGQHMPSSWPRRPPCSRVSSSSSSGSSNDDSMATVLVCRDISVAAALMQQQQQHNLPLAPGMTPGCGGLASTSGVVLGPCSSPGPAALQPTASIDPPGLEGWETPQPPPPPHQQQGQQLPARAAAAAGGSGGVQGGHASLGWRQQQQAPASSSCPAPPRAPRHVPPHSSPSRSGPGLALLPFEDGPAAVLSGAAWGELLVARGALVVLLEVTWGVLTSAQFGAWAGAVRQLLNKGGKKKAAVVEPSTCTWALVNHATHWAVGGGRAATVEVNSHLLLQLLHTWRSAIWTLTHAVPGASTAVPDQACAMSHPQHIMCAEDGSMVFSSPWDVAATPCPLPLARTLNCYPPRHSRLGQPAAGSSQGCLLEGLRWEAVPQCYKTTRLVANPAVRHVLPVLTALTAAGALPKEPELLKASALQYWQMAEAARGHAQKMGVGGQA